MSTTDGFTAAGLTRLHDVLARHVDSGRIPGLVALAGHGSGEPHVVTLGTMAHGGDAPMTRDTIFRMASTSKPVAVSATMALLDDCRVRLDDPVQEWLPELADRQVLTRPDGPLDDTEPARRPITVRDLLTSTAGIGIDMTAPGSPIMGAILERGVFTQGAEPAPEPDEWLRRVATLPLSAQPGHQWQYHVSLDVLGVLVARVTGQPFGTVLRERVFDPVGMGDTGLPRARGRARPAPAELRPRPADRAVHGLGRPDHRPVQPAAGVRLRRWRAGLHRRRPHVVVAHVEPKES